MNILQAIEDRNLFRPFLADSGGDLSTWGHWLTALKAMHGLPVKGKAERELIKQCAGRDAAKLPGDGFRTSLLLVGRRSGKSRISALTAAYEAALSGREKLLSPGEIGLVAVVSPTRFQSRVVKSYIRAAFDSTPILKNEIVDETREGFRLKNGVEVQILAGDFRSVRGFTLLAAVVDEICFFHMAEEGKIKSDTELIHAIRPGLSTTKGRLLAIGSPYAARGWAYSTWKRCFGNDTGNVLVWNAPSRVMNPTLPQSVVDDALAEDRAAAMAEYMAQWRTDIAAFVPRELVEALVVPGRREVPPHPGTVYAGFADVSGGRSDDAALAIGHKEGRLIVLDALERYKSPHNPYDVVAGMVEVLRRYGCDRAIGDAYAAEWTKQAFASHGIQYNRASRTVWNEGTSAKNKVAKPKAVLYAELLPRLTAGEVELLDNDLLISQLALLERRTRSGGRDIIDHPPGGHDDLANCLAGVCDAVQQRVIRAGAMSSTTVVHAGMGSMLNESDVGLTPSQLALARHEQRIAAEQRHLDELHAGGSDPYGREGWIELMKLAGRYRPTR